MRILLRAGLMAVSLASIGPAYADGGDGNAANTAFTQLPGVIAKADVPHVPVFAQSPQRAQNGQGVQVYVSGSQRGTWLFPPNANSGANS